MFETILTSVFLAGYAIMLMFYTGVWASINTVKTKLDLLTFGYTRQSLIIKTIFCVAFITLAILSLANVLSFMILSLVYAIFLAYYISDDLLNRMHIPGQYLKILIKIILFIAIAFCVTAP
jgi:predicted small integral membrane protein